MSESEQAQRKRRTEVCTSSTTHPAQSTTVKRTILDILPLEAVLSSSVATLTVARRSKRHPPFAVLGYIEVDLWRGGGRGGAAGSVPQDKENMCDALSTRRARTHIHALQAGAEEGRQGGGDIAHVYQAVPAEPPSLPAAAASVTHSGLQGRRVTARVAPWLLVRRVGRDVGTWPL